MNNRVEYIEEVVGVKVLPVPLTGDRLGNLPIYLGQQYQFSSTELKGKPVLLAELRQENEPGILQTSKHKELNENIIGLKVIFVIAQLAAFNRKRLIEKHINFIVPGKQLYIPDMMMDLMESFIPGKARQKKEKPLPTEAIFLEYSLFLTKEILLYWAMAFRRRHKRLRKKKSKKR